MAGFSIGGVGPVDIVWLSGLLINSFVRTNCHHTDKLHDEVFNFGTTNLLCYVTCTCHVKCLCSLVHNMSPDLLGLYLFRCGVLAVYQENTSAGPAKVQNTEYRKLCVALTVVLFLVLFLESIAAGVFLNSTILTQCGHSDLTLQRDKFTFPDSSVIS